MSPKVIAAALLLCILTGCGFRPMYGGSGTDSVPVELSEIKIALIADRSGQELRNHLLDRLTPDGPPQQPAYTLSVELDERISKLAVERTGLPTRANLRLAATYVLRDAKTDAPLLTGRSRIISSYNLLDADFSTLTSQKNARSRALESIANQIQTRLAAYFAAGPATATPAPAGG